MSSAPVTIDSGLPVTHPAATVSTSLRKNSDWEQIKERFEKLKSELPLRGASQAADEDPNKTTVESGGRGYKKLGIGLAIGGGIVTLVSVLAILAISVPSFSNAISNSSATGAKMVAFMGKHGTALMGGAVGGTALGILLISAGGVSLVWFYKGSPKIKRDTEESDKQVRADLEKLRNYLNDIRTTSLGRINGEHRAAVQSLEQIKKGLEELREHIYKSIDDNNKEIAARSITGEREKLLLQLNEDLLIKDKEIEALYIKYFISHEKVESLNIQVAQLRDKNGIRQLGDDLTQARAHAAQLQGQLDGARSALVVLKEAGNPVELKGQLDAVQGRLSAIEARLTAKTDEANGLNANVEAKLKEVAALKAQLREKDDALIAALREREEEDKMPPLENAEVLELKASVAAKEEELRQLKAKDQQAREQLLAMTGELNQTKKALEPLERINRELIALTAANAELQKEIAELRKPPVAAQKPDATQQRGLEELDALIGSLAAPVGDTAVAPTTAAVVDEKKDDKAEKPAEAKS